MTNEHKTNPATPEPLIQTALKKLEARSAYYRLEGDYSAATAYESAAAMLMCVIENDPAGLLQFDDYDMQTVDQAIQECSDACKYPCDNVDSYCPYEAEGPMDCRNYCGLGVDE